MSRDGRSGASTTPDGSAPAPPDVAAATQRRFQRFSLVLLCSGVLAAALASLWLHSELRNVHLLIGPLLVIGFLLAERLTINLDLSRVGWSISFTEIPLILGVLIAPFEVVLAAHLIAGTATVIGRQSENRLPYNVGVFCFEVTVPFVVATLVHQVVPDPMWVGAVVGVVISPLVSTLLAVAALHILGDSRKFGLVPQIAVRTTLVGLFNTSVGLIGFLVATLDWGWVLVVLGSAEVLALYVGYARLLREHRDLETLNEVSLTVARSGQRRARPPGEVDGADADLAEWHAITDRVRDQLTATRVVLHLRADPTQPVRTIISGEPIPAGTAPTDIQSFGDDPLLQLPGNNVRVFRSDEVNEDVRESMGRRGAQEAMVVPLRGAHHLLGAVEVHDRVSRWRGFGATDERLLRTVASHLATALDNRGLLARLRYDAYHDPLTGLLNRAGFREAAEEPLASGRPCVVVRMDFDTLATVCDALGHSWGDKMILLAGQRIRAALGAEVPLAHLEGSTFAALLPDHDSEAGARVAELLHTELTGPFPVDKLTVEGTAVVGYVPVAPDDSGQLPDVDTLLQRADVAVRNARQDRDPIRGYLPNMGQIFLRRFQLVTQFRQAIDAGHIHVEYQPKVSLPSRQVVGAEALVRWRHPEFGPVSPDEFVPAVEATGLIHALTAFVLDDALGKVRAWLDRGTRLSVAVNLSVRNLDDENFPAVVAEALARHDVPPRLLTLELTESGVMSDPEKSLPILRRLHSMNVVLAVDDFGTGYSSLAYLRQLPVDEVKIDKSFVLGMGTNLGDMAVVKSIVDLGHSLGLTVVAEGVEQDTARDQLVEMGCDVAQGFLISRPLTEDRFEAWLRACTRREQGTLTLLH